MAVGTTAFMIATAIAFTYLVVYKNNKYLGNILFIVIGLVNIAMGSDSYQKAMGLTILLGGIISLTLSLKEVIGTYTR